MWHFNQLRLAEQHQQELRKEVERWRAATRKEVYQPNQPIHRNRRRRKQ